MNEKDMTEIMVLLEMHYPSFFKDRSEESIEMLVRIWGEIFAPYQKKELQMAIERLSKKTKWMPSVAEIIEEIEKTKDPIFRKKGKEEWEKVLFAVRKFGYYNAREGLESLEPITREIVREMGGFSDICQSERIDVERKQFIEMYDEKINRYKELKLLGNSTTPEEKETLAKLQEQFGNNVKQLESGELKGIYRTAYGEEWNDEEN